jgi:2-keto-4-pentenoate hydratase/2-oxohepta-3-ene-1,7-dioic acid hydratase in catechol pathway
MKIANVNGRATLVVDGGGIDVERASQCRLPADPQALFEWGPALLVWAAGARADAAAPIAEGRLGAPSPRPTQVFGIGLNYRAHAAESGLPTPDKPATFTKFPTCITGTAAVELPSGMVDWEVELVVVIGARAYRVAEADGWKHVAGVTVGQDLSERAVQWAHGKQFSLGKSFPGFGPMGPWLVTPDELPDRDDLALRCTLNGETMQDARTSDMVFGVAQLVAELSAILPLLPGDVIFTGTPAGVGASRKPPRFLRPGDVIESWIEGIGTLRTSLIEGRTS